MRPAAETELNRIIWEKPWEWRDWTCEVCGHTEAVPPGKPDPVTCWQCATLAQRRRDNLREKVGAATREDALRLAGAPERHLGAFLPPSRWGHVHGFALDGWTGAEVHPVTGRRIWAVVLCGVAEGGKTMLATELFWRVLNRFGGPGLWIRADDLLARMMGSLGQEERESVNVRLRTAKALLLDDLDRGLSEAQLEFLVTPTAIRHQNQLPTIVTMQKSMETLHRLNAALARRLEEDSLVIPFRQRWIEREGAKP